MVAGVCYVRGDGGIVGTLKFEQQGSLVRVTGEITGLAEGDHGIHIHEYGDNTSGCTTAGGHYDPFKRDHGGPGIENRHVGDLGNVTADANGVAKVDFTDDLMTMAGPFSVVGRSIVLHETRDDCGLGDNESSKKTGNAGGRIACGVIGLTNPN